MNRLSDPRRTKKIENAGKNGRRGPRAAFARLAAVFLFVGLAALTGTYGYLTEANAKTIPDGVSIGPFDMGGKTPDEARAIIRRGISELDLAFVVNGSRYVVRPASIRRADGSPIIAFNVEEAVQRAMRAATARNMPASVAKRIKISIFGNNIPLPANLDRQALGRELEKQFSRIASPPADAKFSIRIGDKDKDENIAVLPGRDGLLIDTAAAVAMAESRLVSLSASPIGIELKTQTPAVTVSDLEPLTDDVNKALARTPLTLEAGRQTWTVSKKLLAGWIIAVPSGASETKTRLALDKTKIGRFLAAGAEKIFTPPKNASFEMKDGRAAVFEPAAPGARLDTDGAVAALEAVIFDAASPVEPPQSKIILPITAVPPKIETADSNQYGIKEIIGIGASNFSGSPKNRRINIRVGAMAVNGTIVPAGAEFSLLKTLGKIDGANGYLEELVIKGNKTKPEYGGGLCQIGTTAFRAALAAGMPITERRNHSYRVPYYERDGEGKTIGPGKDATIYDPAPDFRFLNDTGNAILIQTAVKEDKLEFIFWGSKDGRAAEQTASRVFNVIPPPEKKIIETIELKPGVKKCTEKPHPGSDATFTYTVTYPDGTVKKQDFFSRYRPWGEVCLVGVEPSKVTVAETKENQTGDPGLSSADASGATGN